MICMLKLGERDCLVRGAPGDRRSWASSGLMRCSSFRLMVDCRWEPPAGSPPSLSEPPAAFSRRSLPFRLKLMQSKDLLEEVLPVRTRAGPAGKLRCFLMGLSWMASKLMLAGGDCCLWWCLLMGTWWSADKSASFSRSFSLSRDSRAVMAFLMLLLLLFRLPPLCPMPPPVLVPLGWLLLDAPEEKPSSGSLTLKESSPPLMPSASEEERTRTYKEREHDRQREKWAWSDNYGGSVEHADKAKFLTPTLKVWWRKFGHAAAVNIFQYTNKLMTIYSKVPEFKSQISI